MAARLGWFLGSAGAVLVLGAAAGIAWWSTITGEAQATALRGLYWQASLGVTPYHPGDGGLVPIGSQADLLGRYLSVMDSDTTAADHLTPIAVKLSDISVAAQAINAEGGYVQYQVVEQRILRRGPHRESSRTQGLVTIWVAPGTARPFVVTAVGYDYDVHGSVESPASLSYAVQMMTPQAATPLGF